MQSRMKFRDTTHIIMYTIYIRPDTAPKPQLCRRPRYFGYGVDTAFVSSPSMKYVQYAQLTATN